MSTPIGSLTAKLAVESAAFRRDLGRAARDVASNSAKMQRENKKLNRSFQQLNRSVGKLRAGVGALVGVLAVRQFTQWGQAALKAADDLGKTADAVGLTTDALQELRVAANLSGVDMEKFNTSVERFTKNIGEAREGTGTMVTLLKKSDQAFLDQLLSVRGTEQALDLYFQKLADTADAADRAALAAAAFGRSGVEMVNIVREGTDGLEDMRQTAIDLGIVLEEDLIRNAEQLNDRMALLKGAFDTGFSRGVISQLADEFQLTADNVDGAVQAGREFGQFVGRSLKIAAVAAQFLAKNMRELITVIGSLIALKAAGMFLALGGAVTKFGLALVKAGRAGVLLDLILSRSILGVLAKVLITVGGAAVVWETFGKEAAAALNATEDNLFGLDTAISSFSDTTTSAAEDFADLTKELIDQRDIAKNLAEAFVEGEEAYRHVQLVAEVFRLEMQAGVLWTDEQRRAIYDLIEEERRYVEQLEDSVQAQEDAKQAAADRLEAELQMYEDLEEERKRQQEELADLILQPFRSAINSIQSMFADTFEQIFSGGVNDFSDMMDQFKRIAVRTAAELASTLVIQATIQGSVSGSGGTGLDIGSLFGGLGGQLDSFGANAFGFAGTPNGAFAAGAAGPPAVPGGLLSGTSFSGFLGGAGAGFGAGTFANSLAGGNQQNGMIGSALGSAAGALIGSIIPGVGTVIGGIAGGALGGLVGGLFGGGGVGPNAAARIAGGNNADFYLGGTGADNGGDLGGVIAEARKAIEFLNELKHQYNLTSRDTVSVLGSNNFIGVGNGVDGFRTSGALVNEFLSRGGLTSDNDALNSIIQNSGAQNIVENIELFSRIPGLLSDATSEFDIAMETLIADFDKMIDRADKLGIATDLIIAQRDREIEQLNAQARSPFLGASANIVDFLRSQAINDNSSLSPSARLGEAQRQFQDILQRVEGGELNLSGSLTSAASTLLSLGRQQFASSSDFVSLEQSVRSDLLSVADTFSSEEFLDAAIRDQTEVIASGDEAQLDAIEQLRREIRLLRQELAA